MLQSAVTEQAIAKVYSVDSSASLSNEDLYRKQESMNNCERKVVGNQIFVGPLPKNTSIKDLENIFLSYGKLTHCELKEGMHLAYGFIEFQDRRDAEKAIRQENGRGFMGTRIVVQWSKDTRRGIEIIEDEVTDTLEGDPIHGHHPNITVPINTVIELVNY